MEKHLWGRKKKNPKKDQCGLKKKVEIIKRGKLLPRKSSAIRRTKKPSLGKQGERSSLTDARWGAQKEPVGGKSLVKSTFREMEGQVQGGRKVVVASASSSGWAGLQRGLESPKNRSSHWNILKRGIYEKTRGFV